MGFMLDPIRLLCPRIEHLQRVIQKLQVEYATCLPCKVNLISCRTKMSPDVPIQTVLKANDSGGSVHARRTSETKTILLSSHQSRPLLCEQHQRQKGLGTKRELVCAWCCVFSCLV